MLERLLSAGDRATIRYAQALLLSATAIAVRAILDPPLGERQAFLGVIVAVALSAAWCGTGPAILALVVTAVASFKLFVLPRADLVHAPTGPIVGALVSIASGGMLIWLIGALERFRREAKRQAAAAIKAEARLREHDTYLREFVDHTSALVLVKDLEGRYVLINNRCGVLFPGLTDVCMGTTADDWFPPAVAHEFALTDARVIATGQSHTFEQTMQLDDGEHRFVTVKFPILDDGGRMVAVGNVSTDVTELHHARADLERKERVLRNLIEIQEQEKHHLCGEFHDGLIQYAVGAKMLLESLTAESHLSPTDAAAVQAAIDSLARGIEDGRRVIHGIRPAELDDLGLDAAIMMLVSDLQVAGIEVEARVDPDACDVPMSFAVTIYRIVQEALSNVRRHSHSPRVILDVGRKGDEIEIRVEDFGVGHGAAADLQRGFGITGMKERSRLVGGECRVEFRPGRGTLVTARLPVPVGDDPAAVAALPPSIPAEPR